MAQGCAITEDFKMFNFENDWPDSNYGYIDTEDMLGETITKIVNDTENRELKFQTKDGQVITMLHVQDCCEDVELHDIAGDLNELYDGIETAETAIVNQYDKLSWYICSLVTIIINFCKKLNS